MNPEALLRKAEDLSLRFVIVPKLHRAMQAFPLAGLRKRWSDNWLEVWEIPW